ncbi:MAG: zinc transporter [Phycisphaerales bacterium]|jgi:zinc transporter
METPLIHARPDDGMIFATRLPGSAADFPASVGESPWDWGDLLPDPARPVWAHLDRAKDRAKQWLRVESGLDNHAAELMLAESTRPGYWAVEPGLVVILRGVDLNEGAEPDELISIRMWVEPGRMLTLRSKRFQTVATLREKAGEGQAPAEPGAVLAAIVTGLTDRLGPVVENLMNLLDEVEEEILADRHESTGRAAELRQRLTVIRQQSISLRRYLAPQRDALSALAAEQHHTLDNKDRAGFRRAADQTARCVEDLDELRDRAAVATDELRARREERIGKTTYLLTLVASIALPLGLITGLLGINVGGLPGVDSPLAFWIVCLGMALLGVGGIALFKYIRWL